MTSNLLLILILSIIYKVSLQIDIANSPSYIGSVVHYHPVTEKVGDQEIAEANANNFRTIIKKASTYHTDIIVFPEFALTSLPKDVPKERLLNETEYRDHYRHMASYVPSPDEAVVICGGDSKYAKSLEIISCAARDFKMYVVVNHHEKVDCDPELPGCPSDAFLLYNTNVAFDRDGRVIAKYRKYNLYDEPGTSVTSQPEYSTFRTDFGVTFGQFICADISRKHPATYFIKNPRVTDVIFSTFWYDCRPFLEGLEIQSAWAHVADVNFLAADYSEALAGCGGSGIYAGKRGPIKTHYSLEVENALIVAEIPKMDRRRQALQEVRLDESFVYVFDRTEVPTISGKDTRVNYNLWGKRWDLELYTGELLRPDQTSIHVSTICDRGLCCDFHVETGYDKELVAEKPNSKYYRYHLVVFNGLDSRNATHKEVCALVSCTGESLENCNKYYDDETGIVSPTTIKTLLITRRAKIDGSSLHLPVTLQLSTRQPLNGGTDFAYVVSGPKDSSLLIMHLLKPQSKLTTFGIYGRYFKEDHLSVLSSDDRKTCNAARDDCD